MKRGLEMTGLDLPPAVFSILSDLIEETFGLHYGLQDRDILRDKASARALEAGFGSLLDYYYYLRYDPGGEAELAELAEALVVGETYFFREWSAVRVLVDSFVAPWIADGRRPRIWSAACATGEEPLSLAMLLDARGLLDQTRLVATDISARALERAQRGRFGRRAVRSVPEPMLEARYLRPTNDGHSVPSRIIESIDWGRCNLMCDDEVAALGSFDAILCRNVLIYFAEQTVRGVLDRLRGALIADGVLLVGVSESLLRYGSGFMGEEHGGAFVYRKGEA